LLFIFNSFASIALAITSPVIVNVLAERSALYVAPSRESTTLLPLVADKVSFPAIKSTTDDLISLSSPSAVESPVNARRTNYSGVCVIVVLLIHPEVNPSFPPSK